MTHTSAKPISISILGSTGSIGTQVLDVARRLGPDMVRVVGLAAMNNIRLLAEQAREFEPGWICIVNQSLVGDLQAALSGSNTKVLAGPNGLDELASLPEADRIVVSVAGTPGLSPTLQAIESGHDVAIASKEVLVAAGHLVMDAARRHQRSILPIDSEHSAIFQCLQGEDSACIEKITLTASGGAFRDKNAVELSNVTPEQALAHPTWKMGRKVTVDSATLMNKGLEIIEAKWLFGVDAERIEVVIHPQSIVHSMIRFSDGSVIAQLGLPDMRLPIQYALLYPRRIDTGLPRLDIVKVGHLTFGPVDLDRFVCLRLAMEAVRVGGATCVAMNAADEVAVEAFLNGRIGFMDIPRVVEKTMYSFSSTTALSLAEIYAVDAEARKIAEEFTLGSKS
jgi:1-deoxy-D-xylulose-5-phosphate reductoisomerase